MTISMPSTIEDLLIPHAAFAEAEKQLEQFFAFAETKAEAEGLAIIGQSGTGKSTLVNAFAAKHRRFRTEEGLYVPVLLVSVPSAPTVKSLAEVMLQADGDPKPGYGTENEKTRRLVKLMKETRVRIIIQDEFQHFVDQGTHKVQHHVADWLKRLIDDTRSTLVISGLPSCTAVIDQNVQLARRFSAPLIMPRFEWENPADRTQFRGIVRGFCESLSQHYTLPDLPSDDLEFRLYLASGGLIGYLVKLLRRAQRNCAERGGKAITLKALHEAHMQAIWFAHRNPDLPQPFAPTFKVSPNSEMLKQVSTIGTPPEPASVATRRGPVRSRLATIDQLLVAR
jgi:hypothetical protein